MCDVKKLCTCESVSELQDHWRLEFHCSQFPSWGEVIPTRPEHAKLAAALAKEGEGIMGPLPIPQFRELFVGLADATQMEKVVEAEVEWLNSENPFDFDYQPFRGDRLMFVIGGQEIAFSFVDDSWIHKPHQAYSVDSRCGVDADTEDVAARNKARAYLANL